VKSLFRPFLGLLFVFVLAFGIAACGGDDEESGSSGSSGTTAEETPAASEDTGDTIQPLASAEGKTIVVGSKNFAEQYILGEIYSQALEAAGFTVEKQLDLGSEQIAFRALKRGNIDAYPEYIGTALTSFYRVKTEDVPREAQAAYDELVSSLEGDNLFAGPLTPFENTYRVASTKETAEKYGSPENLSDLVAEAGDSVRLSGFPECRQRTDCYLGLQDKYDWSPKFVSSDGQYADLDADESDFTMAFTTDGPLSTDKYVLFEDDQGLFPPYNVSLLHSEAANTALGEEGTALLERIQEPLTEDVMQQLNAAVAVDKQKPEDVAANYLKEAGFVE
jgi:glycine betaine/choline ABC-type transport system substrate-binding protein